ncbi:MAG TPA: hypothetical protein VMU38_07945 [Candidatus Binatia bacterium]|nr:hypothetical protein [Candidatus Binatia bacterium]
MEIVRNNFGLKMLALALAIVGWAYFRLASSQNGSAQLDQLSIPISVENLPLGYTARLADRNASVTVATKRGAPVVKADEIKAVLDVTNKAPGVYNVPVTLVAPDVVVQSLSPASVTLTIEKIEVRAFPITVHYVGAQPSGIVVSDAEIRPNSAMVRAPTSELAQVSAVQADLTLPETPKAVDAMVRPIPVDASGAELPGLTVAPNLVRIRVHFIAGAAK